MRNIESALLAQLGLKVDHRKISIAQTAEVRPIEALERDTVRDKMLQRALLFESMSVAPGKRPHRIAITVTLSFRGQTETAEEEASDTPRSRVEGAAKASVTVIDRLLTDFSIALEGAKIVEAFDREFAFVAVQGLGGRETLAADRHGGDQGERGAGGGVRGAGRDQPVDGGAAAGLGRAWERVTCTRVFGPSTDDETGRLWSPVTIGERSGAVVWGAGRPTHYGKDTRLGDPGLCST